MSDSVGIPQFSVIPGAQVQRCLDDKSSVVVSIVEDTYRLHGNGRTVNPPSYFLRFPDRPDSRIIALPASVAGDPAGVDGIKWVSSFPANIESGLPRASAVLVLNDPSTGYPYACLEASVISAARTAASAALAADVLTANRERPRHIGFLGTGLISRYVHKYLADNGWEFTDIAVHDRSADYAEGFRDYLRRAGHERVTVHGTPERLIRSSELVVFATTSARPHITDPAWFEHHPVVLHVSLRDLAPEVIRSAVNVVDDVEHCLKADTSVHLLEQQVHNRDFVAGTLYDVLTENVSVPPDQTIVFSPFGLGVLDLAVGQYVYREIEKSGQLNTIDGFFSELSRHG
ncbi:MAG: 2,3-diaminopropionate biosynthesis protein SbnB [Pseudonocardiaceae bacterium]|nr:2,3-diaminopropionate biosynthesis protein SbnB [Pseudonocardiaceae bacterium]